MGTVQADAPARKSFVERVDYALDGYWIPVYPSLARLPGITPLDMLVFGCVRRWELATVEMDDTRAWVSVANIARTLDCDERTVRRCVARLVESGLIERTNNLQAGRAEWRISREVLHGVTGGAVVPGRGRSTPPDRMSGSPSKDGPNDPPTRTECPGYPDRMPPLHRSEKQAKQDQKRQPPADDAPSVFDGALDSLKAGNVATPPPEPQEAAGEPPAVTEATVKAVRRQVHTLYMDTVCYCHDLNGLHVQRLTTALKPVATKRREALSVTVERAVRAFLADPYWQPKRWPLNGLVSQCIKYADPPSDTEAVAAVVDKGQLEFQAASIESKIRTAQTDLALAKSAGTDPERVKRIEAVVARLRGELTACKARLAG